MSTVREKIQLRLKEPENPERRQIALSIQEEKLNQLERIARAMSEHSGRNVSRNMLIDDAIEAYIEEAIQMLTQNDLWPVFCEVDEQFDTVVLPTNENGFQEVFLGQHQWYYAKLDKRKVPKIKYLALYVKSPVSAITHYGKVAQDGFRLDEEKGKYLIRLEGAPIKLAHSVQLGETVPMATRSPRYTTLEKLKDAQYYDQL